MNGIVENTTMPLATASFMLLFTQLADDVAWLSYVFIAIGTILAIVSLTARQKRFQMVQQNITNAIFENKQAVGKMHIQVQEISAEFLKNEKLVSENLAATISLDSQKQVTAIQEIAVTNENQMTMLIQTVNDSIDSFKAGTLSNIEQFTKVQASLEKNATMQNNHLVKMIDHDEAFSKASLQYEESKDTILKQLREALASLEQQAKNNIEKLIDEQGRKNLDLNDKLTDLEETMRLQLGNLISVVEDSQSLYEELTDKAQNYNAEISILREKIAEDLDKRVGETKQIIEQLSGHVSELADSKHFERQQAMEVQQKLMQQFKVRETVRY